MRVDHVITQDLKDPGDHGIPWHPKAPWDTQQRSRHPKVRRRSWHPMDPTEMSNSVLGPWDAMIFTGPWVAVIFAGP